MKRIVIYIILIMGFGLCYSASRSSGVPQKKVDKGTKTSPADTIKRQSAKDSLLIKSITADSLPAEKNAVDASPSEAVPDSLSMARSILGARESLGGDSLPGGERSQLSRLDMRQVDLESPVDFSAQDSLVLKKGNRAFMYGDGKVAYGQMNLNAEKIQMALDSATVYAIGVADTAGNVKGNPVFQEKNSTYESKSMKYNFRTQRGYITDVITEQGEGFLVGGATKKMEDGSYFIENGRYTTCDDHEHPHFYFQITRGKAIPKKNIVTGPAYMVLADVPLPIALPFGYFPFSKDYSSGVIFPSFGEDYSKGFYMRNGGYYFAINDYVDLALRGEIYTKGSWGITARSNYVKRYKFSGSFDISYISTVTGDKGTPDYQKGSNFQIIWNHMQDSKANPNMSFSASVNYTTSGYTRNDLNSYYSQAFTENTKSSTVNMTYRFPGTKWSISTTANIAQRTQDSTLTVSFPNVTVTLSQVQPFKRKRAIGGERWYEKIRLSYSGQLQNQLTAKQNQFFKKSLIKDWRNGMRHSIPISATFSVLKYFNISPQVQLNDKMYTSKVKRMWDPNASCEVMDTTYGFYNIFDFNASLSMDTKLYLFYKPWKIFGDKVQMIRHVITPTITISGSPDFGSPFWGYYGTYSYTDAAGMEQVRQYSYFQNGVFGGPPTPGKTGMISMGLSNNLEMKVKSDADTTGVKKISLIENLSFRESYNFAADSLRWSNLQIGLLLRLMKNFNLNLQTTWDPYAYELSPSGAPVRVDKSRISKGKGLLKLASAGTSFSYTFNNDTFKKKESIGRRKMNNDGDDDYDDGSEGYLDLAGRDEQRRQKENEKKKKGIDADGYAPWAFRWSLTLNYSISYGYGDFDYEHLDYKGRLNQNLSISGSMQPTPGWDFRFSASYNFQTKKLAYMNCTISRDLHCFTMSASFVPVGPYKSYNFNIAVKSSLLKDLKWDKRSSSNNGIRWY